MSLSTRIILPLLLLLVACNSQSEPSLETLQGSSAEQEIAFLKRFKLGQSYEEARKRVPAGLTLSSPTTDLDEGELPEDRVAAKFDGTLSGYLYFEGSISRVGRLVMVEVFTDDKSYLEEKGKKRIEQFTTILGKPSNIEDSETEDGIKLYSAEWKTSAGVIRYADLEDWGSSISLSKD